VDPATIIEQRYQTIRKNVGKEDSEVLDARLKMERKAGQNASDILGYALGGLLWIAGGGAIVLIATAVIAMLMDDSKFIAKNEEIKELTQQLEQLKIEKGECYEELYRGQ
jgi:hypothetical protein